MRLEIRNHTHNEWPIQAGRPPLWAQSQQSGPTCGADSLVSASLGILRCAFPCGSHVTRVTRLQARQHFQRQIMSAQNHIRFELLHVPRELCARVAREKLFQPIHPSCQRRIIRRFKKHSPNFRRMFDQFHITIGVDFPVQRRKEFQKINPVDHIFGPKRSPRLIQSRRRRQMPSPRRDSRNQYTHSRT